VNGIKQ